MEENIQNTAETSEKTSQVTSHAESDKNTEEKTKENTNEKSTEIEENEVEFEDTEEEPKEDLKETKETFKKPIVKPINSEFARRRRQEETEEKISEAMVGFVKTVTNGVNPYTNKKIKDSVDAETYLLMKEIENQGGDPLADYPEAFALKYKRKIQEEQEKQKKEEWLDNDVKAFCEKYPSVSIESLANDPKFIKFSDGKIGVKPLAEIYDDYNDFVNIIKKQLSVKEAQNLANKKSSPGALSTSSNSSTYFTKEEIEKMSQKEIEKNFKKIQESIKKWDW